MLLFSDGIPPRKLKTARLWDIKLKRGVKKPKTTKTLPQKFKVNLSTKVCSNHFTAGYMSDVCSIPTLYLKGYDQGDGPNVKKRKSPTDRSSQLITQNK